MLRRSPATAGTACAAVLPLRTGWANGAACVAPFAPDLASIHVRRPREGRKVGRGSCVAGGPDGPGAARRRRGLRGAGRTVSARTAGSLLPDSRFGRGRGGRAAGDAAAGLAGAGRVRRAGV